MSVFKKLTGADVRVTPIPVKFGKTVGDTIGGINKNPSSDGEVANYSDFNNNLDALFYNSIRQLFYGSFISQNFLSEGSVFSYPLEGALLSHPKGIFSRFDPSFQGSMAYERNLPISYDSQISIFSISTKDFGESLIPGSIEGSVTDDFSGNLLDGNGDIIGNIFYDQGILVRTDGGTFGTVKYQGSYTIYSTQYKCTASPQEFNYTMNPTILEDSTHYNSDIVDSDDFMPFVTTIGLYNENQELILVGKLSQAVRLNPYTDTNFIVRIDR